MLKPSFGQTLSAPTLVQPDSDSRGRWNPPGLVVLKPKLATLHQLMPLPYSFRWRHLLLRGSFMELDRLSMERSTRSNLESRRMTTLIRESTQVQEVPAGVREVERQSRNTQILYLLFPQLSPLYPSRTASLPFLRTLLQHNITSNNRLIPLHKLVQFSSRRMEVSVHHLLSVPLHLIPTHCLFLHNSMDLRHLLSTVM